MLRALAFYNYGRKHFNRKGYLKHPRKDVEGVDLSGRVYVVTGSNSGIGKALAEFLFGKGARVYMVCRSESRANAAREEVIKTHGARDPEQLRVLVADMSLRADIEKCAATLLERENALDGLVCNAGALMDKLTMTSDGVELTFACHFLMGTYWLGEQLMPALQRGQDPRVVIVSSGGQYNARLPRFDSVLKPSSGSYNGQLAYAKAKRAQVELAGRWADQYPGVRFVSSHPGWVSTPGVDKVYGSFAQWLLSPLRSPWEGTEGIAWLCVAPGTELKQGELYLDGKVEPKHLHKSTECPQADADAFFEATRAFFAAPSAGADTGEVQVEAASADAAADVTHA